MKILSIGNSFSQDAHRWLAPIAHSMGQEIEAVNLYIGGCSLERHWNNARSGEAVYEWEKNGVYERMISLASALEASEWDVITLQQASPLSGIWESYQPYLADLYALVRRQCPGAQIMLHQTWAYDAHCTWEGFANYHHSTQEMERTVAGVYRMAAEKFDMERIPVGDVIAALRVQNTIKEESLTRDGAHLSYLYGRYAAGLTWAGKLCKADVERCTFVPAYEGKAAEPDKLACIARVVADTLKK